MGEMRCAASGTRMVTAGQQKQREGTGLIGGLVPCSILECGQMPNVTVALPNIRGALCSTLQSLADAHY